MSAEKCTSSCCADSKTFLVSSDVKKTIFFLQILTNFKACGHKFSIYDKYISVSMKQSMRQHSDSCHTQIIANTSTYHYLTWSFSTLQNADDFQVFSPTSQQDKYRFHIKHNKIQSKYHNHIRNCYNAVAIKLSISHKMMMDMKL